MNTGSFSAGRSSKLYAFGAVLAGFIVWAIAFSNRLSFPLPLNDDARFFLAAWSVATEKTLYPVVLHAPGGIYWVPDGFAVLLGAVLTVFGRTAEIARDACTVAMAATVTVLALCFRKMTGSSAIGGLCTLLLLTPPVIFAANIIRMECVVCLILSLAILFHLHGRYVAALALMLLGLLFHPALLLALMFYAVALYVEMRVLNGAEKRWEIRRYEWWLMAAVLIAIGLEIWHIACHVGLFREHMAYQARRKESRTYHELLWKPQAALLLAELAAMALLLKKIVRSVPLVPIFAAVTGLQLYAVLGGEVMYDVYSVSVGPAIFFSALYSALMGKRDAVDSCF